MGAYADAARPYFDSTGLFGRHPNPKPLSEGNPATETGSAFTIARLRGERIFEDDRAAFIKGINFLRTFELEPGIYHKKPGTRDEITRDDIYGIIAGSIATGADEHRHICTYGVRHGWVFSNTGKFYPSAVARPWDIGFYKLAASELRVEPTIFEYFSLCGYVLLNAYTKMDDPGSKRLGWLATRSLRMARDHLGRPVLEQRPILKSCVEAWEYRIDRVYGGPGRLFTMYKNDERHPFAVYCPKATQDLLLTSF